MQVTADGIALGAQDEVLGSGAEHLVQGCMLGGGKEIACRNGSRGPAYLNGCRRHVGMIVDSYRALAGGKIECYFVAQSCYGQCELCYKHEKR
jgi:hypothetical protein